VVDRIPPAMRADLDRILADGIAALLERAAEYDGTDIIEANVELANDLYSLNLPKPMLYAAVAALALRLHRAGDPR